MSTDYEYTIVATNDTVTCPSHTDTETGSIRVIATPSLGIADPAVENQTLCEGQSLADVLGNIIYNLENGADDVILTGQALNPLGWTMAYRPLAIVTKSQERHLL